MGYDLTRFKDPVDVDLTCLICKQVLEDPIQVKCCESLFCETCINDWLKINDRCPGDGKPLDVCLLLQVSRGVLRLINSLEISCRFASSGCKEVSLKVSQVKDHEKSCLLNVKGREDETRSDIKELRDENKMITEILKKQINAYKEMKQEMREMREELVEYKRHELERQEKEKKSRQEKKEKKEEEEMNKKGQHVDQVMKLMRGGVIKSENVINAMTAIDGNNFFHIYDDFLKHFGEFLEKVAAHLTVGAKVLDTTPYNTSYRLLCMAQMVGEKGSVVSFVKGAEVERQYIEVDHKLYLTSERLTLLEGAQETERLEGAPRFAPYHMIIVSNYIRESKWESLKLQLTVGGKVIDDEGKVLHVSS